MYSAKLKLIGSMVVLAALAVPTTVSAADPPAAGGYKGVTITPGTVSAISSPGKILKNIAGSAINILLFLAGAAAVIYLIWAGIKYMSSGGDAKKAGEARTAILNAVIGIIVVVTTWTIISVAFSVNTVIQQVTTSEIDPNNP